MSRRYGPVPKPLPVEVAMEVARAYEMEFLTLNECRVRFGVGQAKIKDALQRMGVKIRQSGNQSTRDRKALAPLTAGPNPKGSHWKRWCQLCSKLGTTKDGLCEKHQAIVDEIVRNDKARKGTPAQRQRRRAA